jgi:hypothetical protein
MTIRFPAGHQGKPGNVFHVVARLGTPDGGVATSDKGETMYIGIGTLILIILLLILIF